VTIESDVAQLVTDVGTLVSDVATQQTGVNDAVSGFAATTARVDALSLVDNTADIDKPVSTAAQTESDTKQDVLVDLVNISTVNGVSLLGGTALVIERSATSLASRAYDDRADTRLAPGVDSILDDSVVIEGLGLFLFVDNRDEPDDDETCFTPVTVAPAVLGQWVLSVPAYDLLAAIDSYEYAIRDELDEDESTRFAAYIAAS
jgi:hypothetical protein